MKGRAVCPNCKHKFILDISKTNSKKHVSCPKCKHKFDVKLKDNGSINYSWEEHGEPRKTILSSIKPKTKKPRIAVILLILVFSIGLSTAFFSEIFVESTMDIASNIGSSGTVEFKIIDYDNNTIKNVNVKVSNITIKQDNDNIYRGKNIDPGINEVNISIAGYISQKTELLVIPFISTESTFKLENGTGSVERQGFDSFGCSVILLIFSVFALISIIACLRREHFDIAIMGSFLAIFSFGFFFIGSILSIIAFVIILKSRDEFKNGDKGKVF